MPNSVMEYMYWKLPVVATDIPGIRELLGSEHTDFLFKVGDAKGFAEKVQWLVSDENRYKKTGFDNHKRVVEEFSLDKILPGWIDAINK
jgi:glycosyltransferase involved in cell wall biosynthesis